MLRTLSHLAATAVLLVGISILTPDRAESTDMHLRLTKSQPGKDSLLASAPTQICLWYSQEPQLRLSSVTLTGPQGAVQLGKVTQSPADSSLLVTQIEGAMVGGDYTIAWRTASADGHVIRGTIPFSVRPE
ncbi:MAG: copper resistance protein CopC [Gemmatimonadetes bacterium]|nr:copper resistance protein CopC [Gemmatimonadota bacterium]MCA9768246.1 copper resistance protein CopC [Gemmatimonadota bacterium]HPF61443.1 copper resistance protein CopC [Gemmatimonadales bacterium]HRX19131.1 copper resistance protein CopC [Gemmatimonadales bacterium]